MVMHPGLFECATSRLVRVLLASSLRWIVAGLVIRVALLLQFRLLTFSTELVRIQNYRHTIHMVDHNTPGVVVGVRVLRLHIEVRVHTLADELEVQAATGSKLSLHVVGQRDIF